MNKEHSKKMIAPIIFTILLVINFIVCIVVCLFENIPLLLKLSMVVIPLGLAGVSIYVLVERIKEIRSGVEDDLSKY